MQVTPMGGGGGSLTWTLDCLIGMMESRPVKMKSVGSCSFYSQSLARSISDQSITAIREYHVSRFVSYSAPRG